MEHEGLKLVDPLTGAEASPFVETPVPLEDFRRRILAPSPQFHFVDLAHSFLDGRLDTDTPRERSGTPRDDDAPGYREACELLKV